MKCYDYNLLDAHCDTLTTVRGDCLLDMSGDLDVRRLSLYNKALQVMDLWVDIGRDGDRLNDRVEKYLRVYDEQVEKINRMASKTNISVRKILEAKDVKEYFETENSPKNRKTVGFLLGIEGGEAIGDKIERLYELFDRGVRLITLTWNTPAYISDTNCCARDPKGLTEFGKLVVKEMNRLGMIVDLSHISDAGFWDTIEITEKPVIASHSDARALCGHSRNLTDDMFKALIKNGGVTGINFCTSFLGGEHNLDTIAAHVEHFAELGGIRNIGMGSDFDGIGELPGGLEGCQSMYRIFDKLLSLNYSEEDVNGIAWKNFARVFEEILPQ